MPTAAAESTAMPPKEPDETRGRIGSNAPGGATRKVCELLRPDAVIKYRGATEKILTVDPIRVETVAADSFATWSTTQLNNAIGAGDVTFTAERLSLNDGVMGVG